MPNNAAINRRSALAVTGAGLTVALAGMQISVATAEPVDPLLYLVREYRHRLAVFDTSPLTMTDEEDAALAATWEPLYEQLCFAPPNATTLKGAIEAVRLVRDEEAKCGNQPDMTVNVLNAALSYLEQEAV